MSGEVHDIGQPTPLRVRREPPAFRRVSVRRTQPLSPHMIRVTLAGPELDGFTADLPAASVRVLVPVPPSAALVVPTWNGNEFLLPDGSRPPIRTLTPRRVDPASLELDVDVVIHDRGAASRWALETGDGSAAAVSGPGRGYLIDPEASDVVLLGDESAIPAIGQLLEAVAPGITIRVFIEVDHPDSRITLPDHPGAKVEWLDRPAGAEGGGELVTAAQTVRLDPGTRLWAAGEASVMQRVRRLLFDERGFPRARATVRGYWKHGRSGDPEDPT